MAYKNHLRIGGYAVEHKRHLATTNLHSKEFESFVKNLDEQAFTIGTIPAGYEHRADKISNLFYGTPLLDWVICWTNNVSDPFQQLNVGDRIKIVNL
tara:strand:+ start:2475 stop:2765 length:291 start_codon:yes stop_codon:yes gene_type:complete